MIQLNVLIRNFRVKMKNVLVQPVIPIYKPYNVVNRFRKYIFTTTHTTNAAYAMQSRENIVNH